jgi:copper(I)-binding protein
MQLNKIIVVSLVCLILSACVGSRPAGQSSAIQISDPWVKAFGGMVMVGAGTPTPEPTRPSDMAHQAPIDTALYMTIQNTGGQSDRLLQVKSDVATKIELHTVEKKGNDMVMHQVPSIDVPASGEVQLMPGSFHVMLFGLTRDLKTGDMVDFTLQFEKAGSVSIKAQVRQP